MKTTCWPRASASPPAVSATSSAPAARAVSSWVPGSRSSGTASSWSRLGWGGCQTGDEVVDEIDGVVEAFDEDAFAASVGADVVFVGEDAADAIGGNAGADETGAVGGAGFHGGDDGGSGPELVGAGGDGGHHLRVDGGVGRGHGLVHFGEGNFGIVQHLLERALDIGGLIDGQEAAVDDGGGKLREGVLGVAGGEHGGHAGGAQIGRG